MHSVHDITLHYIAWLNITLHTWIHKYTCTDTDRNMKTLVNAHVQYTNTYLANTLVHVSMYTKTYGDIFTHTHMQIYNI